MNAGRLGLLTAGLMFSLAACNVFGDSGPAINSFTASPSTIMAGSSSTLAWSVDTSATSISISGVGDVTGDTNVDVTPSVTTEYTLTAENADGTSTDSVTVTVSDGNGGGSGGDTPDVPSDPTSLPEGTFGVSTSASGPFDNNDADGPISSDDDDRIIDVAAGSTFYAQVDYTDPDGIASVSIQLRNSSPEGLSGTLPISGFTVGEPTGDCSVGSATAVTCVYPITVDPTVVDISELDGSDGEFAYVFRAEVADTLGNSVVGTERGYVNIDD